MNKRLRKKMQRKINRKLVERYPFLMPRNVWTDDMSEDYNYDYTLLDDVPSGWRKAFGYLLIEELREELLKFNYLNEYRVLQIKEKYGQLRWYDAGYPSGSAISDIIRKYEVISENVCIICGKPDVPMVLSGWISPYCEKCWPVKETYKKLTERSENRIREEYTIRRYSKGESTETKYDIKDTVEKIRANYGKEKKHESM